MIRKLFGHIVRQPRSVRSKYAFGFATTFTGIVALVWVLNADPFTIPTSDQIVKAQDEKQDGAFSTITKQAKEQMANIRAAVEAGNPAEEGVENSDETGSVQGEEPAGQNLAPQNPNSIILSEEDLKTINEKADFAAMSTASSTATSTTAIKYQEVLIATSTGTSTEAGNQ